MSIAAEIAGTILAGFNKHYRLFREISAGARDYFERGDWPAAWTANRGRIGFYDLRVIEAVAAVRERFPEAAADETLWPQIKLAYIGLLYEHRQPECAETFYNSVACRVLHRTYYNNQYIFWRPAVSTEFLAGDTPTYRCYYPHAGAVLRTLRQIVADIPLALPFENLRRDLRDVLRAVRAQFPGARELHANAQVQVLTGLFYRNKAAYILGRIVNGNQETPFALPLRRTEAGAIYFDALLFRPEHIATLFSLARAYFMVEMEVPSAYVSFLSAMMPQKPRGELYTAVGLQKQGKTLFYRDLHDHLAHSSDRFVLAPGIRGMVMLVFTLPSLPYVFKIIRDRFEPPKDTSRERVKEKYLLVKHHDRVGRMADTLEYSNVALPLERFDPTLLEELDRLAPSTIEREGASLVIRHMYIERRMTPLDMFLKDAGEEKLRHGLREYGNAIRELAGANIFPGDLLLKNFGVTRFGRVVFYDYDEIQYLTDVNFRSIPTSRYDEDEYASEPWYSVGPNDVFPEEFARFLFATRRAREIFMEYHAELLEPDFWIARQERLRAGFQEDLFPYPQELRFSNRFRGEPRPSHRPSAV